MTATMNSRSEIRRLAVQNPDALVEEIERLIAQNRRILEECKLYCDNADDETRKRDDEIERLRKLLKMFRDGYDCDADAHQHGTPCRCCLASAALAGDGKAK